MGRPKKYLTEEERLEAKRAYKRKYYQEHKQEVVEKAARYYQEHKTERAEYDAKRYSTKERRAFNLINAHKREDKKFGRGECDLTIPWFVRNIFTKCIYCGESDWKKLGADRIDNDLPHTMENVVSCCTECNHKRGVKLFEQFYWEMKHEKTLEDLVIS